MLYAYDMSKLTLAILVLFGVAGCVSGVVSTSSSDCRGTACDSLAGASGRMRVLVLDGSDPERSASPVVSRLSPGSDANAIAAYYQTRGAEVAIWMMNDIDAFLRSPRLDGVFDRVFFVANADASGPYWRETVLWIEQGEATVQDIVVPTVIWSSQDQWGVVQKHQVAYGNPLRGLVDSQVRELCRGATSCNPSLQDGVFDGTLGNANVGLLLEILARATDRTARNTWSSFGCMATPSALLPALETASRSPLGIEPILQYGAYLEGVGTSIAARPCSAWSLAVRAQIAWNQPLAMPTVRDASRVDQAIAYVRRLTVPRSAIVLAGCGSNGAGQFENAASYASRLGRRVIATHARQGCDVMRNVASLEGYLEDGTMSGAVPSLEVFGGGSRDTITVD